jgi:diacylglycerol kinase family enzyme
VEAGSKIMRVTLSYNERAGEGVTVRSLREALETGGYEVAHLVEKDAELAQCLDDDAVDLVVAAGGDGTVRRAAQILSGRPVPLAILPLGTANNIAKSLDIGGSMREIIASWQTAMELPLDLGHVSGAWGEHPFLEGVGGGLVPAGIAAMESSFEPKDETPEEQLHRALDTFARVLARLPPRLCTWTVDGVEATRELIVLEVLNMPAVGPNLALAAEVNPADGFLSIVAAGPDDRGALARYLRARLEGDEAATPPLPSQQAQKVELRGWSELHLDDEVRSGPSAESVSIEIHRGVLRVLAPKTAHHAAGPPAV